MSSFPSGGGGAAEIFDRGYRPYNGPRSRTTSGILAITVSTVQRALGLRRKFRFKVVPILVIFFAHVSAIVHITQAGLLGGEAASMFVPAYPTHFEAVSLMMIILTATVVPETLGSDRITGMLGLYMASPINLRYYLASKFLGAGSVLLLVTMLPVVFLIAGYSIVGVGPDGFVEALEALATITAAGVLLSTFLTLFGMAATTLTSRRGFASVGILTTPIITALVAELFASRPNVAAWVKLLDLRTLLLEPITRMFDATSGPTPIEGVSTPIVWAAWTGACALFTGITVFGYMRVQVTK